MYAIRSYYAAGDYLKERYGTKIVAVEALECPTLLYNGFGGHNIQGIGDKHVPYVHNVMNTDFVAAVSDASTDSLITLFNTPEGRDYLVEKKGLSRELVESLSWLGISSICNILAGVKAAKYANFVITSYSIHYTKLYEMSSLAKVWYDYIFVAIGMLIVSLLVYIALRFSSHLVKFFVITSYSIHYTKLYEID